ncbi:hypothetical protein KY285_032299 [Solanum tuberosum]|nr:hypothetical protein KY285_032299 [Solanum tuberosum]
MPLYSEHHLSLVTSLRYTTRVYHLSCSSCKESIVLDFDEVGRAFWRDGVLEEKSGSCFVLSQEEGE